MSPPVQGLLSVVGRLFIITIFFTSAVMNKVPHFSGVSADMASKGIPLPQVALALAIIFLVAGSVSVLLGYQTGIGAALLAVFLVLATYYYHPFWLEGDPQAKQNQMAHFMKNFALLGTMIFLIANGPGAWSMDARRKSWLPWK